MLMTTWGRDSNERLVPQRQAEDSVSMPESLTRVDWRLLVGVCVWFRMRQRAEGVNQRQ